MRSASKTRELTDRHVLTIMVAFFGVIIGVNVTMAVFANSSWSGLVVRNAYVASQQFNERAAAGRAQAALGWTGQLAYASGSVSYRLVDGGGEPVAVEAARVEFRHPTDETRDRKLRLATMSDGTLAGQVELAEGQWIVEILVDVGTATPYRDVRRVLVADGELR